MQQQVYKDLRNEGGAILDNIDSILAKILHFFRKLYVSPLGESWR